jgi:hypothetical protein
MSPVKHNMDFTTTSILCLGVQRLVDISNKMKDPSEHLGAIPVVEARVVDATYLIDQRFYGASFGWKAVAGEISALRAYGRRPMTAAKIAVNMATIPSFNFQ